MSTLKQQAHHGKNSGVGDRPAFESGSCAAATQAIAARLNAAATRHEAMKEAMMDAVEHALAQPISPPSIRKQIAAFESAQYEIRRAHQTMLKRNLTRLLLPHARVWREVPDWLEAPAGLMPSSARDLAKWVLEPEVFEALTAPLAKTPPCDTQVLTSSPP